jgi:hypothetical protein
MLISVIAFSQGTNWRIEGNSNVDASNGKNKIGSINKEKIEIITDNKPRIIVEKDLFLFHLRTEIRYTISLHLNFRGTVPKTQGFTTCTFLQHQMYQVWYIM